MNYKTGEILCMVSSPGFDPVRAAELAERLPARPRLL
jgi:cell division protein FtsI/penicillin-binding protein 2